MSAQACTFMKNYERIGWNKTRFVVTLISTSGHVHSSSLDLFFTQWTVA